MLGVVRDRTAGADQAEVEFIIMDLRPIRRTTRGPELTARRALRTAALCIAAFESSQLVFHSATRPSWADASEQMAHADVAPTGPLGGEAFATSRAATG